MIAWVWELRLENASVLVLNLGIPSWWLQSESIFATMFGSDSHRVCVRVSFLFFLGGETCLQTSLRGQDLGNLRLGIYLEHCRLWELLLGFLRLGIFMPTNAREIWGWGHRNPAGQICSLSLNTLEQCVA